MNLTHEELLEISIKLERDGKRFYTELAKIVQDPVLKDFFKLMAREEAQHEKQFKHLFGSKKGKKLGWENNTSLRKFIDREFQTDIFPPPREILEELPNIRGIHKALDIAIEAERIAGEFFKLLQESCNDIEIKTQLTILEKLEAEHLEKVLSLKKRFLNNNN
ncbi:MAG: ferritin family protein [Nitrospinae bacterium]|nr:ferritin family protein [Nitrospinota bacterium]